MGNKVYVVTGGNRGIGFGLVQALLGRSNVTIVATTRSENAARTLQAQAESVEMTRGTGSILHIVHLDFTTAVPVQQVKAVFEPLGLDHIDVVVLNAGIAPPMVPAGQTTAEDLRAAFETNTIAPLLVFQGLWPLVQKSPSNRKVIWISSSVGSIGGMEPLPGGAYGPSRAAQNWLVRALHSEYSKDGLIIIALHPGWVQTRMGQAVADEWRTDKWNPQPDLSVDESVASMLKVIDAEGPEDSGKLINAAPRPGEERILPW